MTGYSLKERLYGFIYLAHLMPTTVGTLYMLLGVYLAADWQTLGQPDVLRAALVVFLTISYSFVINDYFDIEVDRLNKPNRPLPSGRVRQREGLAMALVLALAAFLLALTLAPTLRLMAIAALGLGTAYSLWLKNTLLLGNIAIALLDASTILVGGLAGGQITAQIWVAFVLIFLFVLAQEVLFAAKDYEGDLQTGYATTANRLGKTTSLFLFKILAVLFAVTTLLPALLRWTTHHYLWAAVPLVIVPILAAVVLLTWQASQRNIWISTRIVVVLWLSSFLPILLMK